MDSLEGENKSDESEELQGVSQPPHKIDKSILHQEDDDGREAMVYLAQNTWQVSR